MQQFHYASPQRILQTFGTSPKPPSEPHLDGKVASRIAVLTAQTKHRAYFPRGTVLPPSEPPCDNIDPSHPAWDDLCNYLEIGRKRRKLWREDDWEMPIEINWQTGSKPSTAHPFSESTNPSASILSTSLLETSSRISAIPPATPPSQPKLPSKAVLTPSMVERKLRKVYDAAQGSESREASPAPPTARAIISRPINHANQVAHVQASELPEKSTRVSPLSEISPAKTGQSATQERRATSQLSQTHGNQSLSPVTSRDRIVTPPSSHRPPRSRDNKTTLKPLSQLKSATTYTPASANASSMQDACISAGGNADYFESTASSVSSLSPQHRDEDEDFPSTPQHQVEPYNSYVASSVSSPSPSTGNSRRSTRPSSPLLDDNLFPPSSPKLQFALEESIVARPRPSVSSLIRRGEPHRQPPDSGDLVISLSHDNSTLGPSSDLPMILNVDHVEESEVSSQLIDFAPQPTTPLRDLRAIDLHSTRPRKDKKKLEIWGTPSPTHRPLDTGSPQASKKRRREFDIETDLIFSQPPPLESTPFLHRGKAPSSPNSVATSSNHKDHLKLLTIRENSSTPPANQMFDTRLSLSTEKDLLQEPLPSTQDVMNGASHESQEMPGVLEDAFERAVELVDAELDGWTIAIRK